MDDVEDNRRIYGMFLRASGFAVTSATNGRQGVARARTVAPDVIVMDLAIPGIDGWEATRRLKRDGRTRAIPVIALTGHALPGAERQARAAGCDAFLTKPCLPDELTREIERILREPPPRRRRRR